MKTEYNIKSNKISKDLNICYISDIHSDTNKLRSILEEVSSKVDAILIGGDLLDSNKDYTEKEEIKKILKEYSKKVKIYIGLGNHELIYFKKVHLAFKEFESDDSKYWEDLGTIVNVSDYPKDKTTITKWSLNKDVDITAVNLPIKYYWGKERNLNKYLKQCDINSKKYNILLLHTPINVISKKSIINELKEYDLILCGHMHAGLVPKIFRKKFGRGLVGPYTKFLPKYSYGLINDKEQTTLISGGVSKLTKTTMPIIKYKFFRNIINKIYPSEIEMLNFTKK
jgi:predicted MPP superfamily phosphohydrolase